MKRRTFLKGIPVLFGAAAFASQLPQEAKQPMTHSNRMPALFISHGSPMNALMENAYTQDLKILSKKLPTPKAVLVISAHWMSDAFTVSTTNYPQTIHDFYGFPDELFFMEYDADGAPQEAKRAAQLLGASTNESRGLDHGAWTVLHYLFPERDVPVFQLSVSSNASFENHYEIGEQLSQLRDEGIMIIGSGNVTHNLRDRMMDINAPDVAWAKQFSKQFEEMVMHDPKKLCSPNENFASFHHAHPTLDHYLPILPVMGSKKRNESIRFFHQSMQYGTLDMSCLIIGEENNHLS